MSLISPISHSQLTHCSAVSGVSPFSISLVNISLRDIGRVFIIRRARDFASEREEASRKSRYSSSSSSRPAYMNLSVTTQSEVFTCVPSSKMTVKRSPDVCFSSRIFTKISLQSRLPKYQQLCRQPAQPCEPVGT